MKNIANLLIDMAQFYGYEMEDRQLELQLSVLSSFPEEIVREEIANYMRNPKNGKFPTPIHKLLEKHLPKEPENKDLAIVAAARVRKAIHDFGWPSPLKAKEFIGDLGWQAVQSFGGWQYICENLGGSISVDSFNAQLRELCRSTLELNEAGIQDQPIMINGTCSKSLEQAKNKDRLNSLIQSTVKRIGD